MSVSICDGGWHSLIASDVRDPVNVFSWHGKWSHLVPGAEPQGHEPVSTLLVSSQPQEYCSEGTVYHRINVFLMGLHMGTKL